jgi:hypothetical protein
MKMKEKPISRTVYAIAFVACAALSFLLASGLFSSNPFWRLFSWLSSGAAVIALGASFGYAPWKVIMDDYNQGNLQNLLTYSWFVLLSSAFVTGSFINAIVWSPPTPNVMLFVAIQPEVWVLAGILLGGATMNSLIDTTHAHGKAPDAATETDWAKDTDRIGRMYLRPKSQVGTESSALASTAWLLKDTVSGRQKGEHEAIAIGALQQLLLQATTAMGYLVAIGMLFYKTPAGTAITALPGLPQELLILLGVSTGGQALKAALPAKPVK